MRLIEGEPRAAFSTSSPGRTSDEGEEQRGSDAVHTRTASQMNDGNVMEAENKSIIPR